MKYEVLEVPDDLKDLVTCFFTIESLPDESVPVHYQSVADSCPEMIIRYSGGFQECRHIFAYLRTQRSVPQELTFEKKVGLIGVRLFPHALQQLFNVRSDELINRIVDLKDIAKEVTFVEKIIASTTVYERVELLSDFIRKIRNQEYVDPMTPLVRRVVEGSGNVDIPELRAAIGLSTRQFERRFKKIAGFTPKHLARIRRFQTCKRTFFVRKFRGFSELEHGCEYTDHSHFIREFKEFAGVTPTEYFSIFTNGKLWGPNNEAIDHL